MREGIADPFLVHDCPMNGAGRGSKMTTSNMTQLVALETAAETLAALDRAFNAGTCDFAELAADIVISIDLAAVAGVLSAMAAKKRESKEKAKANKPAETRAHRENRQLAESLAEMFASGEILTGELVRAACPAIRESQKVTSVMRVAVECGLFERVKVGKAVCYRRS